MWPESCSRKRRSAALIENAAPSTFVSTIERQCSGVSFRKPRAAPKPALAKKASSAPKRSTPSRTRASWSSKLVTSQRRGTATSSPPSSAASSRSLSSERAPSTTRHPSRTARRAVAAPMPLLAPVIARTPAKAPFLAGVGCRRHGSPRPDPGPLSTRGAERRHVRELLPPRGAPGATAGRLDPLHGREAARRPGDRIALVHALRRRASRPAGLQGHAARAGGRGPRLDPHRRVPLRTGGGERRGRRLRLGASLRALGRPAVPPAARLDVRSAAAAHEAAEPGAGGTLLGAVESGGRGDAGGGLARDDRAQLGRPARRALDLAARGGVRGRPGSDLARRGDRAHKGRPFDHPVDRKRRPQPGRPTPPARRSAKGPPYGGARDP